MLLTCQAGYERLLEAELAGGVLDSGPGWVRTAGEGAIAGLAFAHLGLEEPVEITGESVNALAQGIAGRFLESLRGEKVDGPWPSHWAGPAEHVGLGRRISSVEAEFGVILRKKLARVAKLAVPELPRGPWKGRGLFVFFADFHRAFVARSAQGNGQRRMADDERAPSRSYLKVEEAYVVSGLEPRAGEWVVDLGAAPGGWSFSAAQRGCRVIAVDNGPMKSGALDHPQIEHRREDAFGFKPAPGETYDWLFCDLLEEPHHVIENILDPWLKAQWCRRFVVNLKFGRVDPVQLLQQLRAPGSGLSQHAGDWVVRHLYHDREEFTVCGSVK